MQEMGEVALIDSLMEANMMLMFMPVNLMKVKIIP